MSFFILHVGVHTKFWACANICSSGDEIYWWWMFGDIFARAHLLVIIYLFILRARIFHHLITLLMVNLLCPTHFRLKYSSLYIPLFIFILFHFALALQNLPKALVTLPRYCTLGLFLCSQYHDCELSWWRGTNIIFLFSTGSEPVPKR